MLRKYFLELLQNKNTLMLITALIFITGTMAFFNDSTIISATIITLIILILLLKNIINIKYTILWILIFYIGFFNASTRTELSDELSKLAPTSGEITGQIISIPNNQRYGKIKFFFKTTSLNKDSINGKTLITVTSPNNNHTKFFDIGKTYKISNAKIRLPQGATNPSQFDYEKYLKNYNTHTVIYADEKDFTEITSPMTIKWKFLYKLNNIRNNIINTHSNYIKSPNIEILGGIVFGDDAVAPPDYIKDSFTNSGLLHILAASGMNVAFIYSFWYFAMRRLKVPFNINVISGIGIVILYTLMTGLGASVVRAALMLIFVLLGKLIDRDSHSVSLLSFVALLMIIYNPAYINDIGFQLSFIVTFGLLTTATIIQEKIHSLQFKFSNYIIPAILIPVVAQIWVIPIQMFYFNTISTYSVLTNIVIVPFLSIVSFGGFISSIIATCPPLAKLVCPIIDWLLNISITIIVNISNGFSNLPNSIIETTHPSVFQLILYYCVILAITFLFKIGFNKKVGITICAIITIILLSTINIPNKNFEVISFDVKNADAFLLKTPQNKYFIIDTGKSGYNGGKSQAEYIILKYMKDKGIKNIEGIIITHFDNDHSGGAYDILRKIRVNNVYINSTNDTTYTSTHIYNILRQYKITTHLITKNQTIYEEKEFKLTTTCANFPETKHENENSIITIAKHNNFEILFTGDAGIKAFEKLKTEIPANIEVLKVGHHGANNVVDQDMINYLNPKISLISTGANTFGHPSRAVLDTLRNTKIYRTDLHHSIKIISQKDSFKVQTFDKTKHKYITQEEIFLPKQQQSHQ